MPVLGLGTWQMKRDTARSVANAIDLGFRMIDTSGDYGTQSGVGTAIRRHAEDRNDLYVVTKVEETDDAYSAAHRNLSELGLDYVDLLLIHRPPEEGVGEDLWRGLMRAKREGLAHDIGVSNYSAEQLERLADRTGETPSVNQIEWTPFGHSGHMLDFCRRNRIVIQAYSPLTRTRRLDDPVLVGIAARHDKTPAQVLLRWDLQLGVAPLPKANRAEHQAEDFDVFDFELDATEMDLLGALNEHYSSLGELPYH
jgi:diketogulonate reductase-like aldo/keto reductase